MLKQIAVAVFLTGCSVACSQSATAASNNWSGVYVGVNGGYGWSSADINNFNNTLGFATFDEGRSPSGEFAGGQIGAQLQSGAFVYGLDFSFDQANILSTGHGPFNSTQSDHLDIDQMLLVTGRLGYAVNDWMAYGKAGLAVTNTAWYRVNTNFYEEINSHHTGLALGGGVDWKVSPNWSLGLDYTWTHFTPATDVGPISGGGVYEVTTEGDLQTVSLRLNYLLGPDGKAK